jgi:hypothetical protein
LDADGFWKFYTAYCWDVLGYCTYFFAASMNLLGLILRLHHPSGLSFAMLDSSLVMTGRRFSHTTAFSLHASRLKELPPKITQGLSCFEMILGIKLRG